MIALFLLGAAIFGMLGDATVASGLIVGDWLSIFQPIRDFIAQVRTNLGF